MDEIILEKGNPSIEAIKYLRQDYNRLFYEAKGRKQKVRCRIYSKKNAIVSYLKKVRRSY